MECPNCSFNNPDDLKFCGNCGTPLILQCTKCGNENPAHFKFCGQCGGPLIQGPEIPTYARRSPLDYTPPFLVKTVLKARSALVGERKLVSVLFADVVNFVPMSEHLDPEEVHQIMDGCFEILGREVHGAGGSINQYTGDGIMALFGAPIAYDDHIKPACHAALQIQQKLRKYGKRIVSRYKAPFQMRIGIHSGKVLVGAIGDNLRLDYTAVGDTTNLAARLQSLAQPEKILVSDAIRRSAESHFRFRDAGLLEIKGKAKPVRAFFLEGEIEELNIDEKVEDPTHPFVGRDREIALLKQSLEDALDDGPKLVAVTGEAGMGKSRLLHHFFQSLQPRTQFLFEGRCQPYTQTVSFYPLSRMFLSYFHLSDQDSFEKLKKTVRDKAKGFAPYPKLEEILELFREFIRGESDSEAVVNAKRRQLFRSIRDLLLSISALKPIIMFVQNMQWADASTRAFLSYLAQSPGKAPILLVCLGRTDPALWVPGVPDHLVRLKPLTDKHAGVLLSSVIGTRRLDPQVSKRIISKAGGNPLFLVETGEALKRQKLLVCGSVKCTLALPFKELKTPESIQGVLASRLDSLPASQKRVAQLASIVGREFSFALLAPLAKNPEDLTENLEGLEKEGIIERTSPAEGGLYQFRQEMMREVAYGGLPRTERKHYHKFAGEAIEKRFRNNLSSHLSLLAHHFYVAQEWVKAFAYTLEAGNQARHAYACEEALICFDRGLDILSRTRPLEHEEMALQLYEWKGSMHFCLGQMESGLESFETMYSEATRLKDPTTEAEALFRIGWISFYMHRPGRAEDFLLKAIDLGEDQGRDEILLKACSSLGFAYAVLGRLKDAGPLLTRALSLSEGLDSAEGRAWSIVYLLQYYNWTGEYVKALGLDEELKALNREIRSPYFVIFQHFAEGLICGALGDIGKARKSLETGLKQLEVGDDKFWRPRFLNTLGWLCAEEGKAQEALELNGRSLEEALDSGDPETLHNAEINLGENYLALGNLPEAGKILKKTWLAVKKPGITYARWRYKSRLFIALGELYGRSGERKKGLDFLRRAIDLAKRTGARKHQARALFLRGRLMKETRPRLAQDSLDEALALSDKMGTRLLSDKIRKELGPHEPDGS